MIDSNFHIDVSCHLSSSRCRQSPHLDQEFSPDEHPLPIDRFDTSRAVCNFSFVDFLSSLNWCWPALPDFNHFINLLLSLYWSPLWTLETSCRPFCYSISQPCYHSHQVFLPDERSCQLRILNGLAMFQNFSFAWLLRLWWLLFRLQPLLLQDLSDGLTSSETYFLPSVSSRWQSSSLLFDQEVSPDERPLPIGRSIRSCMQLFGLCDFHSRHNTCPGFTTSSTAGFSYHFAFFRAMFAICQSNGIGHTLLTH